MREWVGGVGWGSGGGWLIAQSLEGSFSPVSKQTFATARIINIISVRCEFREMGTPEARNLISVRCGFTIYLFLEGFEK